MTATCRTREGCMRDSFDNWRSTAQRFLPLARADPLTEAKGDNGVTSVSEVWRSIADLFVKAQQAQKMPDRRESDMHRYPTARLALSPAHICYNPAKR